MKKISFITLFPELFESFKEHSIIRKAISQNEVEIDIVSIRDFATDKNQTVDDYIYGGGHGMLLLIEPVVKAIESIKTDDSYVIYLGPKGKRFTQRQAKSFSQTEYKHLIFISGHYEGIDSRISHFIDEEISIGDFILTGGEYPSIIVADAIIRLIPNVLKEGVTDDETFENNYIEYNHYSKPIDFRGYEVPQVLLSGDHKKIERWRKKNALDNTINYLTQKREEEDNGS